MKSVVAALDRGLFRTVSGLTATLLLAMVLLAFAQVLLRNLMNSGIGWADVVLRHMVLWVGLLGGVLATHESRQIGIDLLPRLVNPTIKHVMGWISGLFVIAVSGLLAHASWVFVQGEMEFGSTLFGDVPAWYAQSILPVGFALIAVQMLLNLLLGRAGKTVDTPEALPGEAGTAPECEEVPASESEDAPDSGSESGADRVDEPAQGAGRASRTADETGRDPSRVGRASLPADENEDSDSDESNEQEPRP